MNTRNDGFNTGNNDGIIQSGELLSRYKEKMADGSLHKNMKKFNVIDVTVNADGTQRLIFKSQGKGNYNCKLVSDSIIKPLGITSEGAVGKKVPGFGSEAHFQIGLESSSGDKILFRDKGKRKEAIQYIDKALEAGDPVVAGVHFQYRKNKPVAKKKHNEGTTDHYLVIVGRYNVKGKTFYKYWDVGSSTGKTGNYYFELKSDFKLVSNITYKNRTDNKTNEFLKGSSYIVTQIRRNKHYIEVNKKKKYVTKKY